jgi:hypothetical protein
MAHMNHRVGRTRTRSEALSFGAIEFDAENFHQRRLPHVPDLHQKRRRRVQFVERSARIDKSQWNASPSSRNRRRPPSPPGTLSCSAMPRTGDKVN